MALLHSLAGLQHAFLKSSLVRFNFLCGKIMKVEWMLWKYQRPLSVSEMSPFIQKATQMRDDLGTRTLGQLRSFSCGSNDWLFFWFSFQSIAAHFELDHQAAASYLLKTCLVGLKFFRLNPGNGSKITFTNDMKSTW